jgi:ribosomal protein S18 acetylase RimI-like enzyme
MPFDREVAIRPATTDDYAGIAAAFDEVHDLHCQALPYVFRAPAGHALERAEFEAVLADPEGGWLVAERGDAIVGFVKLRVLHAPDRPVMVPRDFAEVDALGVRADQQRAGIGRALMAAAEAWAAERGLREIELGVWEFNQSAMAFYEQLGYTTERRKMRRVINDVDS